MNKKEDLIVTALLARLTEFQLLSSDNDLFNFCEDIRDYISNYELNKDVKNYCAKCGCNEFLCGHNKRT
ncbi:MAG: hypothetical protein KDC67_11985 [Ignavibacteriae bacterium]|nr:hypothetical protein [Ignavibacteriota bacterium]